MTKFIKDPIHGEIEIPREFNFIDELINTREMKRLKNIYQLGECFNVFLALFIQDITIPLVSIIMPKILLRRFQRKFRSKIRK